MIPFNTPASVNYTGTDNLKIYDFPFRVERDSDIKITIYDSENEATDLVLNTDFTYVANLFPRLGGKITLTDLGQPWLDASGFLKSGFTIFISFKVNPDQLTLFNDINNQTPKTIEKTYDRLVMNMIGMKENINRALQIPEGGGGEPGGVEFPPLPGNENRTVVVNETATGFTYGPTTGAIFAAAEASANSALESEGHAEDSLDYRNQSQGFSIQSMNYRDQAQGYRDETLTLKNATEVIRNETSVLKGETEAFRDQAEVEAIRSETAANRTLYSKIVVITSADSPVNLTNLDKDTMFRVDASVGPVNFYLPQMITVDNDFKIGIVKTDDETNAVTIFRTFTDTINDGNSMTIIERDFGVVVFAQKPSTNWKGRYFILESTGNGGGGGGGTFVFDPNVYVVVDDGKIPVLVSSRLMLHCVGDGGPQDANDSPFANEPVHGQEIVIRGTDSVNFVAFHSVDIDGGLELKDTFYATKGASCTLIYNATTKRAVETSRVDKL